MYSRTLGPSRSEYSDVVLVPGMIISSNYMVPLALLLSSAACRVHLIDFPGYGRSDKPERALNISELAESLKQWTQANGIHKANFVANSFGCQIVTEFAAKNPEMVDSLVLQGPTVDPAAHSLWRQMFRLRVNSFREAKSVGMISVRDYKAAGFSRVIQTIKMTLRDRIEQRLPQISSPTLVVRGSRDPVVPQEWAEEVVRLLPNARLCQIPGAAHTLNYSEPEKLCEAVMRFLSERKNGASVSH